MTVRHEQIDVRSSHREETIDITPRVKAAVTRSKIKDRTSNGTSSRHSSARCHAARSTRTPKGTGRRT